MQYELVISATAFHKAEDGYVFYENESHGLGDRFLKSVENAFQELSTTPKYYGYISSRKDIRDMKIKSFPFVIIFQIIKNKVFVLRVFNTNRDPRSLKNLKL